jgi:hypothetical protein
MAKIATKAVVRTEDGTVSGVVITFADGRTVELTFAKLSEEIIAELAAHGAGQKLGDSYSGCGGNVDYAFAECSSVAETLLAGQWNRRGSVSGILAEAIAKLTGKPEAEVTAHLATTDADTKDALKKRKDVKAMMAQIRADRLKKSATEPDGDALADLF